MKKPLVGLIGSSITLYQLQSFQNFRVNWKTVGVATLGFALGNALLNTIYKSGYETKFGQLFFWGLIGGACLAYPSKDLKRYLILGCCTGLGILSGLSSPPVPELQFLYRHNELDPGNAAWNTILD